MSPLELAILKFQFASVAGECDRHCAILQHEILNGVRLNMRRKVERICKKRDDDVVVQRVTHDSFIKPTFS